MPDLHLEVRKSRAGEPAHIIATGIRPAGGSALFSGEPLPDRFIREFGKYLDDLDPHEAGYWKIEIGDASYQVAFQPGSTNF